MLASRGRTTAFTDADLSYSPDQILDLLSEVEDGWDVVVGSRRHDDTVALVRERRLASSAAAASTCSPRWCCSASTATPSAGSRPSAPMWPAWSSATRRRRLRLRRRGVPPRRALQAFARARCPCESRTDRGRPCTSPATPSGWCATCSASGSGISRGCTSPKSTRPTCFLVIPLVIRLSADRAPAPSRRAERVHLSTLCRSTLPASNPSSRPTTSGARCPISSMPRSSRPWAQRSPALPLDEGGRPSDPGGPRHAAVRRRAVGGLRSGRQLPRCRRGRARSVLDRRGVLRRRPFRQPGRQLTASHNPAAYNGMKLCLAGAKPVGRRQRPRHDQGHGRRRSARRTRAGFGQPRATCSPTSPHMSTPSSMSTRCVRSGSWPIPPTAWAGWWPRRCSTGLPFTFEMLYGELDGNFPNHPADPIQPENLVDLQARVLGHGADVGLAFDGDADRVFLVDDKGQLVSGSLTTAMVAKVMLDKFPGSTILHNLICSKAVPEVIIENGGTAVRTRVGHSLIKKVMAETGAAFGVSTRGTTTSATTSAPTPASSPRSSCSKHSRRRACPSRSTASPTSATPIRARSTPASVTRWP